MIRLPIRQWWSGGVVPPGYVKLGCQFLNKRLRLLCVFDMLNKFNLYTLMVYIWVFPKIVGFPPKASILIRFSSINHPFCGTPIFGNIHIGNWSSYYHPYTMGMILYWIRLIPIRYIYLPASSSVGAVNETYPGWCFRHGHPKHPPFTLWKIQVFIGT